MNKRILFLALSVLVALPVLAGCDDKSQPAEVPTTVVSISPSAVVIPSASVSASPSPSLSVSVSASPME